MSILHDKLKEIAEFFFPKPKFIVNEDGEFGVRVRGRNFYHYKSSPLEDNKSKWRDAFKREFGESIVSPFTFEPDDKDLVHIAHEFEPSNKFCRKCGYGIWEHKFKGGHSEFGI